MSRYLTIGPVRFVLQGAGASTLRYDGWAYRGFFTEGLRADAPPAQIELSVQLVQGGLTCPSDVPWFEAGKNWAVWPDGEGWLFCSGFAGRKSPRASCWVSRNLDRATLYIDGDLSESPLRYPIDQILAWGLLSQCGGVLLHAAAVVRDGVGYVFAGRSGAGKSTLSALCRDEGWSVLNDDRVILFRREGRVFVSGTPWHGSGCFAEATEVPLGGLFLLAQSETDRLDRLDSAEARLSLLEAVSIPWFEEDWSQGALDALDNLLSDLPIFRFHFTKTSSAVQVLSTC